MTLNTLVDSFCHNQKSVRLNGSSKRLYEDGDDAGRVMQRFR